MSKQEMTNICVRMPLTLKNKLALQAASEHRTMSMLITKLVTEYLSKLEQ